MTRGLCSMAGTLAGAWFVFLAAARGQTPYLSQTAVFASGQDGYAVYRIPAIVCSTNGTLLAFCEARSSSSDGGQVNIALRRSTNDGAAWNAMQIVAADGTNTIGNAAPVVDANTGEIFLLFCENNDRVFYTASMDDGVTWAGRVEITDTCKAANWGWYATGPGHGIQLKRGAQAGRLVVTADHQLTNGVYGDQVIYSDDDGASWQLGAAQDAANNINPNENQAVEVIPADPAGGARLYFNSRNNDGPAPGNRTENWSTNGGSGYVGVFTNNPGFVCPVVEGSLLRVSATDEGAGSDLLLFACPNDPANRVNISLWSSTNEAGSWSAPKSVYSGLSGYSDMTLDPAGDVVLLSEQGTNTSYDTLTAYIFNQAWLNASNGLPATWPEPAFWTFEEKSPGAMCDTNAGAILGVSPAGYQLNLTAQGPLAYVAGDTNYGAGSAQPVFQLAGANVVAVTNLSAGSALHFDGTNGLQLGDAASSNHFDFGPGDSFTLETVFRVAAGYSGTGALVAKDLAPSSPSWWLRVESGRVRFFVDDTSAGASLMTTNTVNDGQWHSVAAIRDATNPTNKTLAIWLDGRLNTNCPDTTTGTLANSQALNIGRFNASGRNLTGDIDWVRITPGVLLPGQFVQKWTQWDADGDGIPDSYERVAAGNLSTLGPVPADADGDGYPDLVEFALGADPLSAGSRPQMSVTLKTGGLTVGTEQRALPPWLAIELQSSPDLQTWTPVGGTVTVTPLTDGNYERAQAFPVSGAQSAAQFFRLGVVYQP